MSMLRSERAVAAAVAVAARHGISAGQPRVLWDSNNTVVHLHPAQVVAKVAANERRPEGAVALSRELAVAAHLAALGAPVDVDVELVVKDPQTKTDVPVRAGGTINMKMIRHASNR